MEKAKQAALAAIDAHKQTILEVSDQIWGFAELSLQEHRSAALYCKTLQELGFEVEAGICGIETAFSARFGAGRPVIGILGEYDALSGLSQEGACVEKRALVPGGSGHGCGHNLLGAGAMAAAIAVKDYLERTGKPGTVIFFGCPGEEGGASKAFMAREKLWYDLDAALTWHPDDVNEVATGSSNSCIQVQYKFQGLAAHAAGNPEQGRSALDAVELMNIGVQFLREHMSDKARIHYAITDGGGVSPNVVQPTASVLYMVRSNKVAEAVELQKRVDKIADGAALMTETTYERVFIDGLADTVPNHTLERLLYRNFEALGVPEYTEEELALADALAETFEPVTETPGVAAEHDPVAAQWVKEQKAAYGHAMNAFLMPLYQGEAFSPGSTDVGDVSWQTPTGQVHVAAQPSGVAGHSWQIVSCGKSAIGHKALIHAGKVLAATVIDLLNEPETLAAAKAEWQAATAAGYTCPIPAGEVPKIVE